MTATQEDRMTSRLTLVEEHVRAENRHDLDALMDTFGEVAFFDSNTEHFGGRDAVTDWYRELFQGFPDFRIDVEHRHISEEAVILEVMIRGTHTGEFRGIAATGKPVEFPVCAIFTFDERERLSGERTYYDSALLLGQLGVLPRLG